MFQVDRSFTINFILESRYIALLHILQKPVRALWEFAKSRLQTLLIYFPFSAIKNTIKTSYDDYAYMFIVISTTYSLYSKSFMRV